MAASVVMLALLIVISSVVSFTVAWRLTKAGKGKLSTSLSAASAASLACALGLIFVPGGGAHGSLATALAPLWRALAWLLRLMAASAAIATASIPRK